MRMQFFPLAFLAVSAVGCVSRGDIDEIKQNQEKILQKIDAMAKAGGNRPQPQQQPRGPDPAKVYAMPVPSDAAMKGPADAWVTVVEISDFQ